MKRTPLRRRVLLLTFAFAFVLFAITGGLSWRAKSAQERWQRLVGVETRAIAALEELVRAQNAFHARGGDYRLVSQLLDDAALRAIDTGALRRRVVAFRTAIDDPTSTQEEIDGESLRVVAEAQRLVGERKREIARQLPRARQPGRERPARCGAATDASAGAAACATPPRRPARAA